MTAKIISAFPACGKTTYYKKWSQYSLATEVSKNKDGGFSLSYPRFIEFRDKSVDDVDRIVSKGKGFEIVGRD